MPRPIPDNPELIDGWRYYLIALPDNDDAASAGWDAYSELMNSWQWGEEGIEPNSEVMAQLWADAVFESMRIRDMGFPDDILTYIDEVEGLLQEMVQCCDSSFLVEQQLSQDGIIQPIEDERGSEIVRGEGDPPAGLADWDAYTSRLCDGATAFVDGLPGFFTVLQTISFLTTLGLASAIGYLIGAFAGLALLPAALAGVLTGSGITALLENLRTILGTEDAFAVEKAEVEDATASQELICAIYLASTSAGAYASFVSALDTHAPNASPYVQWLPLQYLINRLFNIESSAAEEFGGGCLGCGYDVDVTFTFDTNEEGWNLSSRASWQSPGHLRHAPKDGQVPNPTSQTMGLDDLATKAGEPSQLAWSLRVLSMDLTQDVSNPGFDLARTVLVTIHYADDTQQDLTPIVNSDGTYSFTGFDETKALRNTAGGAIAISIKCFHNNNGSDGWVYVDNVRVAANVI